MDNGGINAAVIMACGCFLLGFLFFGIGIWADRSKKPAHFWAGIPVKEERVSDVKAYNRAYGRMWKSYAVPYMIAGILAFRSAVAAGILVGLACFPGVLFLVFRYIRLERIYISR